MYSTISWASLVGIPRWVKFIINSSELYCKCSQGAKGFYIAYDTTGLIFLPEEARGISSTSSKNAGR